MTSDANPVADVWSRRALTLALCFAYTPVFIASPGALGHALVFIRERRELWALGLYALASSGAVVTAFLALTVGVRFLTERSRKRLFTFLLAYWLPHSVLIAFWGFLEVVAMPGAWID